MQTNYFVKLLEFMSAFPVCYSYMVYNVFFSVWSWFIQANTPQVYGYAILLGTGGSLSLVTCLGMLSHLIGENVVSKIICKLKILLVLNSL